MAAILRAGPFASSGFPLRSFLNEPSEFNSLTHPVNCANTTSSLAWPWRYSLTSSVSGNVHTGWNEISPGNYTSILNYSFENSASYETAANNFSVTKTRDTNFSALVNISFQFFYQANDDFEITIDYDGSISSGTSGINNGIIVRDSYGIIENTSSDSANGSHKVTLPRAIVPSGYQVSIRSNAFKYELPDPTGVNPTNKTVSATLGITF
jgi:hypothetical protein